MMEGVSSTDIDQLRSTNIAAVDETGNQASAPTSARNELSSTPSRGRQGINRDGGSMGGGGNSITSAESGQAVRTNGSGSTGGGAGVMDIASFIGASVPQLDESTIQQIKYDTDPTRTVESKVTDDTWRQAIAKVTEKEKKASREAVKKELEGEPASVIEGDIYQKGRKSQYENAKKSYPKGASTAVLELTKDIIKGEDGREGLARAFRRYGRDSDLLCGQGERERANLLKQQYMEEQFLPAVEVVANLTSPDELLNCAKALELFDQYVMSAGSGTGYTAAYLKAAYKDALGNTTRMSDPTVRDEVMRIRDLVDRDQIRTAFGIAKKLKKSIDSGEHLASDEDYELVGRIASYW